MVILGIDPGYAIVGYGAVEYKGSKFTPIEYGAVTTEAGVPFEERLKRVYDGVCEVMDRVKPETMAIEKLFFTSNQKTAIDVAQARGVTVLAAVQRGISVYEYTPLQVKQAIVGYGKAEKRQVMEMTKIILHLDKIPKPDDAADAVALAICHGHCAGSLMSRRILPR